MPSFNAYKIAITQNFENIAVEMETVINSQHFSYLNSDIFRT